MIDLLTNTKSPGKIDNITLDATISDRLSIRNEITSFPIEDGSSINDHIIKRPMTLTIRGVVTNSPLLSSVGLSAYTEAFKSSSLGQLIKKTGTRVDSTLDELLRIAGRVNGELINSSDIPLITVVTGLKVYTDMVLSSLDISRDNSTGDSLPFTAEFTPITKVKLSYVTIAAPVKDVAGLKTKTPATTNVGRVSSEVAKPKVSVLASLFNKLATGK